jgi:hypothetical protein
VVCSKTKNEKKIVILFGVMVIGISCNSDDFDLDPNYPNEIINSWVESFEKSYGIYRSVDFKIFILVI